MRALADNVAASGFLVLALDFFYGDPYVLNNPLKNIEDWKKAHGTDKGFEDAKSVIAALRSKGVTQIGAAGFCWGAKPVVELAKFNEIQAVVLLHPSFITADDIKEIKSPISILGAETDHASPPKLLRQFEEILSAKPEVEFFVKVFPGVVRGWTMRYDENDEAAVKSAREAYQDMLGWFAKYLR